MEGKTLLGGTSRSVRVTYESEALRLQKEAEGFTQKLEKERRLALLLDDSFREVSKQFEQKQASLKQVYSLKQSNARDLEQITFLETKLNRAKLELGDLQIHNRKLRTEIDSVRKGNIDGFTATKRLTGELEEIKEDALETRKRGSQSVAHETKTRHRILNLHESKAETQLNHSQRLVSLQQEILDDRRMKKELLNRLLNTPVTAELSESGLVTKHLYEKWMFLCRDKRKEVNAYIKRIQDLSAGFSKMKEFSNIDDLRKVVMSFLNSLERQREIQKHMVLVSEQFDELTEELRTAKVVIETVGMSEKEHSVAFSEMQRGTTAKIDSLRSVLETKSSAFDMISKEIEILQGPLKELYQICCNLDLEPTLSEKIELTETSEFNVKTSGIYLIQLEELSEKLISLIGVTRKPEEKPSNGFRHLRRKDFNRTLDLSEAIDIDSQPKFEEEPYPISPPEFHNRAKKALNRTTVL